MSTKGEKASRNRGHIPYSHPGENWGVSRSSIFPGLPERHRQFSVFPVKAEYSYPSSPVRCTPRFRKLSTCLMPCILFSANAPNRSCLKIPDCVHCCRLPVSLAEFDSFVSPRPDECVCNRFHPRKKADSEIPLGTNHSKYVSPAWLTTYFFLPYFI